jgi:hypothetical protein
MSGWLWEITADDLRLHRLLYGGFKHVLTLPIDVSREMAVDILAKTRPIDYDVEAAMDAG